MQALQVLRVYTNVPQVYTGSAKPGLKTDMEFPEHRARRSRERWCAPPKQSILSRVLCWLRLTSTIGMTNSCLGRWPRYISRRRSRAYIYRARSALIFRKEGLQLGTVVNSSNGPVAHMLPIVIGEDDVASVQIVSGLEAGDKVIQDPPTRDRGEKVAPQEPSARDSKGGR